MGAIFSPMRDYRYALSRTWNSSGKVVNFIGLNPSTADETTDDPTIVRCRNFAMAWGYGGMWMTNIFAWRSTDPKVLLGHRDPVGVGNPEWLRRIAGKVDLVVCAWGVPAKSLQGHARTVAADLQHHAALHMLRLTKEGFPAHPLYLPAKLTPTVWLPKLEEVPA